MSTSKPPILRHQIEDAQRHTKSNMAAARYLGVSYPRYRQYAQLYGLFEQHLNVKGIGVDKGFSKRPTTIPLREILEGKHPTYSRPKLKNRLIARGLLPHHCQLCGFDEQRVTDKQVPLILQFKDGDPTHMQLENLHLLCYNCMFLTEGSYQRPIADVGEWHRSRKFPSTPMTTADAHIGTTEEDVQWDVTLSDEERAQLLQDLDE